MNVGVSTAFTTMLMVAVVAHPPDEGVKVYTVVPAVAVLIVEGSHVPVMLFREVVGNVPGVAPTQYGPNCVNEGVTEPLTEISIVVVDAHCPAVGVNV